MEAKTGKIKDIESWMKLVDKVKADFPGMETAAALEEHRRTVKEFMGREEALCMKQNGQIVGALLFSKEMNMLCFLAVDPDFRRQKIAEQLVHQMLLYLDSQKDVTVTTYRDGVPEGIAARAFYQKMGFVPGRLTEEFGSPVQEFYLKREM